MREGRIAALDGLRAFAIAGVLSAHLMGVDAPLEARIAHLLGDLGVRLFFVLSGFLITSLLLREVRLTGVISLRDFYLRRALRIFPALYAYLGVLGVLAIVGLIVLPAGDVGYAVTYTMNFHGHRAWQVGHLWSLAVEEQFYFLWPGVLLVIGAVKARQVAIAALIIAPLSRLILSRGAPEIHALADQALPCVLDGIAMGCLLALCRDELESWAGYRRFVTSRWFWLPCALGLASLVIARPFVLLGPAPLLANTAFALLVHRILLVREGRVTRFLEAGPLVTVGVLSYSLYVWQQLFLNRHGTAWFNAFPVNVILAVAAASLSYRYVERPFLRWSAAHRRLAASVAPRPSPVIAREFSDPKPY